MYVIAKLIDIYIILIVIRALLSWFPIDYYNPLVVALRNITEPVLRPIRRLIPMRGIDFSPFIAIIILEIIRNILAGG